MRLNYYDVFDLISDDAGQLLAKYENSDINLQRFSSEITKNEVSEKINYTVATAKRRKPQIALRLLVAVLIIMSFSIIAIAAYKGGLLQDGASVIDNNNEDLIGKEISQEIIVKDKYGNIIQGEENLTTIDQIIANSSIVKSIKNNDIILNSISYFPVRLDDENYVTPEIIFTNGTMIIFTKEDGSGWNLNQLEELVFETEMFPSEINNGKGQDILFGYIYNGELITESNSDNYDLEVEYRIHANEKGEYYICLIGASSDPIALKKGKVYIDN